jgi:histone-lysine N-methyltransferase SETMAR
MSITNPTDYEVLLVFRFLSTKNIRPTKIRCQLVEVYGEGVMNKGNVCKWCCLFNGGRADVHNEAQSGRLSVITEDLKGRVDAHVCESGRFTIDELHEVFPYVSQSFLYETVIVQLQYRKICARWVPRMLTDEHKQLWIG